MTKREYMAGLSWNDAIGPKRYQTILQECSDLETYFHLTPEEQMRIAGVRTDNQKEFFINMADKGKDICDILESKNIKMLTLDDSDYPPSLKLIPDPPFAIYMRGTMNYSMPRLAIVGTRRYSTEGEDINRYFSRELVLYNIGIVSGLAIGHDSIAQRTVLDNDGYTIAVLGSGIDVIYPPENRKLYSEIIEQGTIISEYPPGVLPDRWRFPLRNRIISGLSEGVFLIEAPSRSGALITCKYAIDQGKEVFTIPGSPMLNSFSGNNNLIQNGAFMALKPEDILEQLLGPHYGKKNIPHEKLEGLSEPERAVYDLLDQEMHVDSLTNQLEINIPELYTLLTQLEIKGIINQLPGNFYIRNIR